MHPLPAFAAACLFWNLACCFPSKEMEEKREAKNAAQVATVDAVRIQLKLLLHWSPPMKQRAELPG
jgi:hypothetical protein